MYKKLIEPFILGVIVSFYFFPIGLTFLPASLNTKVILALFGAFVFVLDCIKKRSIVFSKDVFIAAVIAVIFSALCYVSVFLNDTSDTSYANYFVSFFTWLGGAYGTIHLLRRRYQTVGIHIVSKYLLWVSVAQGISCLMIDNIPAFSAFVDTFMQIGQASVRDMGRMYGIGSALDSGGVRFAIALVMSAYELCSEIFVEKRFRTAAWSILGFLFVIMVGNMISRTTTVGALLGLGYIFLYISQIKHGVLTYDRLRTIGAIALVLAVAIPIVTFLYNTDSSMHSHLRFAFEGFFNWVETGEWRTDSTDKLNSVMWVWPTDTRTWLIGSGLFEGFVFSTDIGYCRFVLYCGIIGFSAFAIFFIYNAYAVSVKFRGTALLSLLLLTLTFTIWIKVSTDIFMVYALLYCADAFSDDEDEEMEEIEDEEVLPSL